MPLANPVEKPRVRLLAITFVFAAMATTPHAAEQPKIPGKKCASGAVYASGEPSAYEWLARIKTHANWRAKVRVMPDLGDPYANWKRAENTTERCFSGPEGTVCQFTGIPCRKS